MKKTAITLLLLSSLLQSNLLAEVTVTHGDMKITLPSQPQTNTAEIEGSDGGPPSLQHQLVVDGQGGAIIVWHQEDNGSENHEQVFDGFRDALERVAGADALHDRSVPSNRIPARLLIVPIPAKKGFFHATYFHFNGRYYQVMAVGPRDFVTSDAVVKMLVSTEFAVAES